MTDEIKHEMEAKRTRAALRVWGRALATSVLLAGGFMAGVYRERLGGSISPVLAAAREARVPTSLPPESEVNPGRVSPAVLEAQLTEQIRAMHSAIARLDDEAKEGRIHYNLLLQRGYSKGDDVCLTLVARQQEIKVEIEDLQTGAREAELLRKRLVAANNAHIDSNDLDYVNESLRRAALRVINRADLQGENRTVIPDLVWSAPDEASEMDRINRH